jgi:type IV pilus biogenesis protein CpaD/CtpE
MLGISLLLIAAAAAPAAPPPSRWGKANQANLAAMARPNDLAQPVPTSPANGQIETAAVTRLLTGKAKDLRRENATQGAGAPQ